MKKTALFAVLIILSVARPSFAQDPPQIPALTKKLVACRAVIEHSELGIEFTRQFLKTLESKYKDTPEASQVLGWQLDLFRAESLLKQQKRILAAALINDNFGQVAVDDIWDEALDIMEDAALVTIHIIEIADPEEGAHERTILKKTLKELREKYRTY